MSKNIKFLDLVEELSVLRKDVPQFVFSEAILPSTMFVVRDEIVTYKKEFPESKEIDFIISSGGGSPADAYRIIRTLRNNFEVVNVIVPFWAKSAATLLSLGASKIIMDEFGEFGPLDMQIAVERDDSAEIDRESALNDEYSVRRIEARSQELYYQMFTSLYSSDDIKINKIELSKQLLEYLASFYKPLLSQINPYHLGKKKRVLDIGEQYAKRILNTYHPNLPDRNKAYLIDYLVNRCPDHGYVIDYGTISEYLKNVKKGDFFGAEYNDILTDMSMILMEEEISFIGFVMKREEEADNVDIPEELQELINHELDTTESVDDPAAEELNIEGSEKSKTQTNIRNGKKSQES